MTKYVHDEIVRAWLDGKAIQYLHKGIWYAMSTNVENAREVPPFRIDYEYRIKPEAMKYRLALCYNEMDGEYLEIVRNEEIMIYVEKHRFFVKWVGDWQEVEV